LTCACGRELGSLSVFTRSAAAVPLALSPPRSAALRAGGAFRIAARVRAGAAVQVSCSAAVGGRAIRTTGTYTAGTAVCSGSLPRGAAGKKLVGTIEVGAGGATRTARFSFPIR
jgi:hypothetical protein